MPTPSARRHRAALVAALLLPSASAAATLFREGFEDSALAGRGWYDNTAIRLSSAEHVPGSLRSAEFRFLPGATTPETGGALRRQFPPTSSVYLSYHVKYSRSWTGSNRLYHPHEFHFVSDVDDRWIGPAYTHLTLYVEQNEGEPLLAVQDGQNIDETNIGVDLTGTTELRAVAGCNGDSDGHGDGDCYPVGSVHRNGKGWRAGRRFFDDLPGPFDKNRWHFVEALFALNSTPGGSSVADGRIAYWFDGINVFDHRDVLLRTGEWPDMRIDQFLIAPYIGDGSPVDQTMWIDSLTVGTERALLLLRNDEVSGLDPPAPALSGIFTGTGFGSLDPVGPDGQAEPGERGREGTNGSGDDDDAYVADFPPGALDPDPAPVAGDAARPLVFYQLDAPVSTLVLTRSPGGGVRLWY